MKGLVKKVISGLLSTAMLVVCTTSLTACNTDDTQKTTNSSFNYETDMQYIYYGTGGRYEPMTKSDTGYYYVGEHNILLYVDKESQKATPLCSKPNCLHTDPDACDAYFDLATDVDTEFFTMSVPIQYYKGDLYMVTKKLSDDGLSLDYYLTKTDKSGKNAENITKSLDFSVCKWMIHRGYFYYATDYSIQRIDLDNPKLKPEKIFTLSEEQSYEGSQNAFHSIIAYGDYIYFRVFNNSVDNENTSSFTMPCFYSLNTSTLESIRLEHQNEEVGIDTFYNDKLIFHIVKNGKLESYMSDLNGDNPEKIEMGDLEKSYISSDGMYLYYVDKAKSSSSENAPMITLYDQNKNKVDNFTLAEKGNDKLFSPQDESFFIYVNKDENNENQLVMADKSQIGTINGDVIEYKTLCKLNWYEVTNSPYIVSSGEEYNPNKDFTQDNSTENIFSEIKENTKNLGYNVSDDYDTFNNKKVVDGFSVKLSWKGDGGAYSGDFQILNFTDVDSAEEFKKENPLVISNKERVAYISIDEIPTEIYKMLSSIISGNPVAPIEVDDFSGDSYEIN